MDNVLYIIGNGFDLHHEINSSYRSFAYWLQRKNNQLYEKLSCLCLTDSLWRNFEEALAYIDRNYFWGMAEVILPQSWTEDDTIAELLYAGDIANNAGEEFWNEILNSFRKWVCTISWKRQSDRKKLMLDYEVRFITFNYTTFLESRYGIDESNILYIHGRQGSKTNPPIIGHGSIDTFNKWYKKNSLYKKYYKTRQALLPEVEMMTINVEEYFALSEKPVMGIINKYNVFFNNLYDIEHIYVLGHSLSDVDMPYFKKIIQVNDCPECIHWHISFYGENERLRLASVFKQKISNDYKSLTMFNLNDIQIKK